MSVAVEECLESAEVTDRVVFFGGKCATVTSTEGGHAVLGDGRTVSLSEARSSLLPEPGQPVLLYGSRVLWLGAGDVDAGYLHCLVLAGDRVEPRTITEATAVVQCPEAKELTARACAVLVGQWQRHEQWKRDLNEAANEYADQHELCERYDNFMEDNGFRGREREFDVRVSVSLRVTLTGHTYDDAVSLVDSSDVCGWVQAEDIYWELEEV